MQPVPRALLLGLFLSTLVLPTGRAHDLLVEAESFDTHGGWKLDTQFIDSMGSPYLLAHGLGKPVADAVKTVSLPAAGTYHIYVRTLDWVARWQAPGQPGRFQLLVNGRPVQETLGTRSANWFWHPAGSVAIANPQQVELTLHDLTGFNGRCDAIYFTTDPATVPPGEPGPLRTWRLQKLGFDEQRIETGPYDLVVVGGGYSGLGSAISAARMGCKVALIQNRPVLGGNGSSEIRVWAQGLIRRGRFPRIGEIIDEFADKAKKSPGTAEEFGDATKEAVVRAEKNIDLFLNHHADGVDTEDNRIVAVTAFDTRTGARRRFRGTLFVDCTGHGTIGALAGADWEMTPKGRMGMSNMWRWENADTPMAFPATPWALDLTMKDFPYPRDFHGQWFWESGFDKDPLLGAEAIRDWNLRAVFGAFNAMKNRDGAAKHPNARLTWIAYIGGPRESRRLLGDLVLTQEDVVTKRDFPDGCVPSTWSIDLHYPKKEYADKFPDNPFISIAKHDRRIDRAYGYPVPYRCFYSRNINNLFMAGRCISVTHEALGTTRVMKTCGMMGEVVGKAASLCVLHLCSPRDVYHQYLDELVELLRLPGKARRATVRDPISIPADALPAAGSYGPITGLDPKQLTGIVVDDREASKIGDWKEGTGLKGYVGWNYLYAEPGSGAAVRFDFKTTLTGPHQVLLAYQPHPNRGTRVPVTVLTADGPRQLKLDMRKTPPLDQGFIALGLHLFKAGSEAWVRIDTDDAGGFVHADAIRILPAKQQP